MPRINLEKKIKLQIIEILKENLPRNILGIMINMYCHRYIEALVKKNTLKSRTDLESRVTTFLKDIPARTALTRTIFEHCSEGIVSEYIGYKFLVKKYGENNVFKANGLLDTKGADFLVKLKDKTILIIQCTTIKTSGIGIMIYDKAPGGANPNRKFRDASKAVVFLTSLQKIDRFRLCSSIGLQLNGKEKFIPILLSTNLTDAEWKSLHR